MNRLIKIFSLISLIAIFSNCNEENEIPLKDYPTIRTSGVSNITSNSVQFNAEILAPGSNSIQEYGFTWGDNEEIRIYKSNFIVVGEGESGDDGFSSTVNFALSSENTSFVRAFARSGEYIVYGNLISFNANGSMSPVIESLTPDSATWGDTITINGQYFSTSTESNTITFNEYEAQSIPISQQQIKVVVPDELDKKTASINMDFYDMESNTYNFVLKSATYNQIDIESEMLSDDIIIIYGENFHPESNKNLIISSIDGLPNESDSVHPYYSTKSELRFNIPYLKNGDVNLQIETPITDLNIVETFKLVNPEINSVYPLKGGFQNNIILKGTNLDVTDGLDVVFSDIEIEIHSTVDTMASFAPIYTMNRVESDVKILFRSFLIKEFTYTVLPPVISNVYPPNLTQQAVITIQGDNFHPHPEMNFVSIGGKTSRAIKYSGGDITVDLAEYELATGTHEMYVMVLGQISNKIDLEIN